MNDLHAFIEASQNLRLPQWGTFSALDNKSQLSYFLKTGEVLRNKHLIQFFSPTIESFIRELRDCSSRYLLHALDQFISLASLEAAEWLSLIVLGALYEEVNIFSIACDQDGAMVDHLRSALLSHLQVLGTRYFAKHHHKAKSTRWHQSPEYRELCVSAELLSSLPTSSNIIPPIYSGKFSLNHIKILKMQKYLCGLSTLLEDLKRSVPKKQIDTYRAESTQSAPLAYCFLAASIGPELLRLLGYSSESLLTELLSSETHVEYQAFTLLLRFDYQSIIEDAITAKRPESLRLESMGLFGQIFELYFMSVLSFWMHMPTMQGRLQCSEDRPAILKMLLHLVLTYSLELYCLFVRSTHSRHDAVKIIDILNWLHDSPWPKHILSALSTESRVMQMWISTWLPKLNEEESLSGLPRSVLILTFGPGKEHETLTKIEVKNGDGSIERCSAESWTHLQV